MSLAQWIVTFFAGMGAGLGTGFAGMSAAAVITPMLVTFLDIPTYEAIGIALASDVLASLVSAITYKKHGNLDVKNGLIMMLTILLFTMVGSLVSSYMPDTLMGNFAVFVTMLMGVKFIVKPVLTTKEDMAAADPGKRLLKSILSGIAVGFICGFVGAGGGIMMLIVLTSVLGYELKTAVGTSVFIMSFTALTGSVSHFVIGGMPDIVTLVLCIVFTFIWARIGAVIANRSTSEVLNRVTGGILILLSAVILGVNLLG